MTSSLPLSAVASHSPMLPGPDVDMAKLPGHWVLAKLGKRVLRPGGRRLSSKMLSELVIASNDKVVELAPGLGVTARETVGLRPASYTGVEHDEAAAGQLQAWLKDHPQDRVIVGRAEETGLADGSATIVYGEAILTMQTEAQKRAMVREAYRLLKAGGRYGIHELAIKPADLTAGQAEALRKELSRTIHVHAAPLTVGQWESLLISEGFEILYQGTAAMRLLTPLRLIRDEGLKGAMRFFVRLLGDAKARKRVAEMRRTFGQYRGNLSAVCVVARKPW